jgi:hypothetical protein
MSAGISVCGLLVRVLISYRNLHPVSDAPRTGQATDAERS